MPANSIDPLENFNDAAAAAVQTLPSSVVPGARVRVRGRACRLDALIERADCRELHLFDLADGRRRVLLWPFDRPAAIDERARVRPVRLREWCARLDAALARAVDPCTPRAHLVRGDVLPYQLAPAMAMAAGAPRLLLADEVGLGKTIQAGWIVADLLVSERDARVLIAVPAGLRRQWASELARCFGIGCDEVEARWLRARIADLPADIGPWTPPGVYLGSVDFLKRGDVVPSLTSQVWDLLVIDEAHGATSPTERHAALAAVASRARRVVTITATPYSGDPASFASMTALGAVDGDLPPLMFRRSRAEAGDARQRRHRFAKVRLANAETRFQRLLEKYSREVWRETSGSPGAARLAVTILRKRALSSPAAASRSLRRRRDLLSGIAPVPRQLALFDDEAMEDEVADAILAAPGLADEAAERRWLSALVDAADAAIPFDSKQRFVRRLLRRIPNESVILFTEYRDTLVDLASALPPALHLHGGLTSAERASVQARFNAEGGLLLATDAAAEGLNLQHRCRTIVNYELPWNPARLEQRIGRVDRIGQRRPAHAITLVARDTAEDLVIASLARRLQRVSATMGERDRLCAFLTEARTAHLVVEDDRDAGVGVRTGDPTPSVARASDDLSAAATAAVRLRAARASPETAGDIHVASIRSSRLLAPGLVICARCAASRGDGAVVADRIVIVHVARVAGRPSAAQAREAAAFAVAFSRELPAVLPDIDRWATAVREDHEAAVDSWLSRETAMLARCSPSGEVQPGLFDNRALRLADEMSRIDRGIEDEHRRRIEILARARPIHVACTPVAVLIAWR